MMEGLGGNKQQRTSQYDRLRVPMRAFQLSLKEESLREGESWSDLFFGAAQLARLNDPACKKAWSMLKKSHDHSQPGEMSMSHTVYMYSRANITKDQFQAMRNLQMEILNEETSSTASPLLLPSWGRFTANMESLFPDKVYDGLICGPTPWSYENTSACDRFAGTCCHVKHGLCGTMKWVRPESNDDSSITYTPGCAFRLGACVSAELAGGLLEDTLIPAMVERHGEFWATSHQIMLQVMTGCDGTQAKNGTSGKTGSQVQILAAGHMVARAFSVPLDFESTATCMHPNHSPFTGKCPDKDCEMDEIWCVEHPNSSFYWSVDGIWGANESNFDQRHDTLGVIQLDHQNLMKTGINLKVEDDSGSHTHHISVQLIDACNDKKMLDCLHGHHTSPVNPCPFCRCQRKDFWDEMGNTNTFTPEEIQSLRRENVLAQQSGAPSAASNVTSAGYEGYDATLGTIFFFFSTNFLFT